MLVGVERLFLLTDGDIIGGFLSPDFKDGSCAFWILNNACIY